METPVKDD